MANFELIDYNHCITNLTSSIEKYFNLEPSYKTLKEVDEALAKKNYKNVIIMVFDGMGSAIINKNPIKDSYLKDKKVMDFKSCYPPTTANCTTCYQTGKNPIDTAWLGWSTYYPDLDTTIDNFTNENSETKEKIVGENIAHRKLGYDDMGLRIESKNKDVKSYAIGIEPIYEGGKNLRQLSRKLIKLCNEEGRKYIYLYWNEPDAYMHDHGTQNKKVKSILSGITKFLKKFEKKTNDSIAFVSADHGQIDVSEIAFYTYYDVMNCLRAFPSCDARTPFFFIKDGMKDTFKELFNKNFSAYYDLFTKDEIIEKHIFGYGKENPLYQDIIGDFVAIAKDKYYFNFSINGHHFKGHHAGLTKDEITIPLIVIDN